MLYMHCFVIQFYLFIISCISHVINFYDIIQLSKCIMTYLMDFLLGVCLCLLILAATN